MLIDKTRFSYAIYDSYGPCGYAMGIAFLNDKTVYNVAMEVLYQNMTLPELVMFLNQDKKHARINCDLYGIPYMKNVDTARFYDPRWVMRVASKDPSLGEIVANPRRVKPKLPPVPVGAGYEYIAPTKDILNVSDRIPIELCEIPRAILALAQYKLGFIPDDFNDPSSVAFRDGDVKNLRPENLVYTGVCRVKQRKKCVPGIYRIKPLTYVIKCSRCGFYLVHQTPEGWQYDATFVTKDGEAKGTLCPVCQRFTDRIWNGSMG